ncbi:MAG TPA: metallophosphoesterase [Acetobacteraceae bacterium]|nr:metallophosphoesterase [Acetobacteraceae bacterium]
MIRLVDSRLQASPPTPAMTGYILFAGDPHRNFAPILRACLARPAGTLVLVGDCDCHVPLPEIIAPVTAVGWQVRWILGNHDTETELAYDNLVRTHPDGDLGLRVTQIAGLRVAGLPGVFKPRVWYPRPDEAADLIEPPRCHTREAFLRALPADEHWRGGLPLWHRDTIFPEDFDRLGTERFDVLVTHEAPSSHPHGFEVIDRLAKNAGARLIVHGHHHQSYAATLPGGVRVRGLGLAEPWVMDL